MLKPWTHRSAGMASVGTVAVLWLSACNNVGTQQGYAPEQPIAFSHALHAGEYKMDCQYCHVGAERSRYAGVPALSTCMNCHTQIKKDSPLIQTIKSAAEGKTPFEWVKVHRYPDFAWFSHENHVGTAGLKCQTCHGPVENMVRLQQHETMTMGWCLDCHRSSAGKTPGVTPPTDCVACHR